MMRRLLAIAIAGVLLLVFMPGCSQAPDGGTTSRRPASAKPLRLEKTLYSEDTSPAAVARLQVFTRRTTAGTVTVEAVLTNLTRSGFWTSPGDLLYITADGAPLYGTSLRQSGTGPDLPAGQSRSFSAIFRPAPSQKLTIAVAGWHYAVPPNNPDPGGSLTMGSQPATLSVDVPVSSIPVLR